MPQDIHKQRAFNIMYISPQSNKPEFAGRSDILALLLCLPNLLLISLHIVLVVFMCVTQDRASWAPKFAALQLAHPLVAYFSKPLHGVMPALMGATWQLLLAAQVCIVCVVQIISDFLV